MTAWLRATAAIVVLAWVGMPSSAAADGCTTPAKLGVVFELDDSGSMSDSDPDLLRAEGVRIGLQQLPDGSLAAASSFDSTSRELFPAAGVDATTRNDLADDVDARLYPSGNTDYDEGFSFAQGQLSDLAGTDKRAVVFLSDGQPTDEDFSADESIADAGVPIYTIGFGDADTEVLEGIAARSGGQTFWAGSAGDLQSIFARIIAILTCDAQSVTDQVDLQPGETTHVPFTVGADDGEFRALAAWSYGDVTVTASRPDTSELAASSARAGETFTARDTYALLTGSDPPAGVWTLNLTAAAGNDTDVSVSIDVWKRQLVQQHPLTTTVPSTRPPAPAVRSECDVARENSHGGRPYSEGFKGSWFSGIKYSHDESIAKLCDSAQGIAGNSSLIGTSGLSATDWCTIASVIVDQGLDSKLAPKLIGAKYLRRDQFGNVALGDACDGVSLAAALSGDDVAEKAAALCGAGTGALSNLSLVKHVPLVKKVRGGGAITKKLDAIANVGDAGSLGCIGAQQTGNAISGLYADYFLADYDTNLRYAIQVEGECLIEGTNWLGASVKKTAAC